MLFFYIVACYNSVTIFADIVSLTNCRTCKFAIIAASVSSQPSLDAND